MHMCCLLKLESLFALHLISLQSCRLSNRLESMSMTVLDWRVSDDALSGGLECGYVCEPLYLGDMPSVSEEKGLCEM